MTADPPTPPTQDDLAAGRELDAEVAEKIMGAPMTRERFGVPMIQAGPGEWGNPPDIPRRVFAPPYSTDIGAAWLVLDEMVWRVGTANIRLDMEDYGRGAGTGSGAERAVWVTIGEHTAVGPAPLAICRAALAVVASG